MPLTLFLSLLIEVLYFVAHCFIFFVVVVLLQVVVLFIIFWLICVVVFVLSNVVVLDVFSNVVEQLVALTLQRRSVTSSNFCCCCCCSFASYCSFPYWLIDLRCCFCPFGCCCSFLMFSTVSCSDLAGAQLHSPIIFCWQYNPQLPEICVAVQIVKWGSK